MTARKKQSAKPTVSDFYNPDSGRMLPVRKVERVLETIGVDPQAFAKAYLEDTSRRVGPRDPSDEEQKAVAAFEKSGNLDALMEALDTESPQTAYAAVTRVIRFRAEKK